MFLDNKLMEKYKRGEKIVGLQLRSHSPVVAEMMACLGIDFMFIDNEHFTGNPETLEEIIRTVQGFGVFAILRIPSIAQSTVLQYLDAGVNGLIAPHIDTAEQAGEFVRAGKYSPVGERGFSNGSRASLYGNIPMDEYKIFANKNTWLMPMIESDHALDHLDAILSSGIDAIHIGQMDLSESMGFGGAQTREVQCAIDRIIAKAHDAHIPVAIACYSPEFAIEMLGRGVDMITLASDLMTLNAALKKSLSSVHSYLNSGTEESAK